MILKALLFSLLALNLAEGAPIAKATSIHDHKMVRPNCSFIKKQRKMNNRHALDVIRLLYELLLFASFNLRVSMNYVDP